MDNACHMKDCVIATEIYLSPVIAYHINRIHLILIGPLGQIFLKGGTNIAIGTGNQDFFH